MAYSYDPISLIANNPGFDWSNWQLDGNTISRKSDGANTLGTMGLVAMGATTAASIYSTFQGMKTQRTLYKLQEEIAQINQRISEKQAQSALRQSEFRIAALTLQAGQLKSTQRTSLAANGVRVDAAGTAAEITTSTDLMKEIDVKNERLNGIMSAWGYRFQGINAGAKAAEYQLRGSSTQSLLGVSGALSQGLADIGRTVYNYNKMGLLG